MRKKGQVTIFIIVGIVLVVGIVSTVILMEKNKSNISPSKMGPRDFIVSCVGELVEDSVHKMMDNGGEITPSQAISYNGSDWNYLCYHADYYQTCYNIHPMLEKQIEKEIVRDTDEGVQECFNAMREDFENSGYGVDGGETEYSIDLVPGNIDITLKKNISITDVGGTQNFKDFNFEIASPIYNLIRIARLIVNDEAQYCNFEYNGYTLLYPQYEIKRISYDESRLYTIKDRNSNDIFKFAIRSCAFPPGV